MKILGRNVLTLNSERRVQVYREIADLSRPSLSFYGMTALSALIAAYGLLAGSTAVVIGAMLVAPLMGPIFGMALALTTGNRGLLVRALTTELMGVALVIGLAALVGLFPWRLDFGAEILARTQPTLYDIIIALAAGLAGVYALINEKVSPALPGVAVAVAVVPPLAVCGLCLAAGQWGWALGAFLLFVANFLAIEIAAALVFTTAGMLDIPSQDRLTPGRFVRRFSLSLLALVGVAIFMTHTLVGLIEERSLHRRTYEVLSAQVQETAGAQLWELDCRRKPDRVEVLATVLTPSAFEPPQVARLEEALRQRVDPHTRLTVRSLLSKDYDDRGPVFIPRDELHRVEQITAEQDFLALTSQVLDDHLRHVMGAQVAEIRREKQPDGYLITATVRTPQPLRPQQVAEAQAALQDTVAHNVRLIIRSVLTRDADAQHFLHDPDQTAPLSPEQARRLERLRGALRRQLAEQVPGADIVELRLTPQADREVLVVQARAPQVFTPEQVAVIEYDLRRHVAPALDLIIRTQVGADASATEYLMGLPDFLTPER